jgi:hypothetical protein
MSVLFAVRLGGTVAICALIAGCDVSDQLRVIDAERAVERIVITPDTTISARARDTVRLSAVAIGPANQKITEAVIEWTSGDPSVARSIGDGRFVAVGAGTAELLASTRGRRGVVRVQVAPR